MFQYKENTLEYVLASICTEEVKEIIIHDKIVNEKLELCVFFDVITHEHIEWRTDSKADILYENIDLVIDIAGKDSFTKYMNNHGGHRVIKSYHEDIKEGGTNWSEHPPYICHNYDLTKEDVQKIHEFIDNEIIVLMNEYYSAFKN